MSESLLRRALLMLSHGRLGATQESAGIQKHQVTLNDRETIDGLPFLQHYGLSSRPQAGSDVLVLFSGGDRSKGVVLGSNDARCHVALEEGEVILHDDQGTSIRLGRAGILIAASGRPVTVTGATTVRVEADKLECTGEIIAHCDGASVTLGQHRHPDPQGGSTSPPSPGT